VTEDVGVIGVSLTAAGSISVSDVDAGESFFQTAVTNVGTPLGTLLLADTGSYSYTVANSAVQSLGSGATVTDTFTITSYDGTAKNVSFTIHGANDAPIAGAQTLAASEGGASVTAYALGTASDADIPTTLAVSGLPAALPAG